MESGGVWEHESSSITCPDHGKELSTEPVNLAPLAREEAETTRVAAADKGCH